MFSDKYANIINFIPSHMLSLVDVQRKISKNLFFLFTLI